MPIQLSSTNIDDADELMCPEIVNGYLYGYYTNTTTNETYLYRIQIATDSTDVKTAEFIGIIE